MFWNVYQSCINLMKKKNYYFIGTNLMRTNAFFISKDYSKDEYFPKIEIKINQPFQM